MRTEPYMVCLLALVTLIGVAGRVSAEGYCIACQGPDATYRCVVAGASPGAPGDPRNQIACVKDLAKSGGHERCSVERFSTEKCAGELRTITNAAVGLGGPAPAGEALPSANGPQPAASVPSGGSGTVPVDPDLITAGGKPEDVKPAEPTKPQTISDLTADTAEAAKQSLDTAGAAIGDTAKKSWDCVTSLFSDC